MSRKDKKGRVLKQGESQRSDGKYQYRYVEEFSGKRKYIYANNLSELREKEDEIKKKVLLGQKTESKNLGEYAQQWLIIQKDLVKPTTFAHYTARYNYYIKDYLSEKTVDKINYSMLLAFYKHLVLDRQISYGTISLISGQINSILDMAVKDKAILLNPNDGVLHYVKKMFRDNKEASDNSLSEAQILAFIDFLKNQKNNKMYNQVMILTYTGMRISELCGLLWEDCDLEHNVINIRHNLVCHTDENGKYAIVMQSPKTNNSIRTIPLLPTIKEILIQTHQNQKNVVSYQGYSGFVFTSRNNAVLTRQAFWQNLKYTINKYNEQQAYEHLQIQHCSPHTLRHTFCGLMFKRGVDYKIMASIMGHSNINITMNRYTKTYDDTIAEEFQKMLQ